jgi:PAS domain S-box-containing protein
MDPFSPPDSRLSLAQLEVFKEAALILTSSADLEAALKNAIEACLPAVADFGFFDVVLAEGVRRTARAHSDPQLQEALAATSWNRQERRDINLCALSTGEPAFHPDTDDVWFEEAFGPGPRMLPFSSMISVPVIYGTELIGALTLFMGRSGRHHTHADLHFAAQLSSLAAPIVVKARLMARQRASEARFELALKVGGMGAWEWNMLDNKVVWSPGMAELHGLPPNTQLARVQDYLDLVYADDRGLAGRSLGGRVDSHTGKGIEYRVVWPDGSVHWLEGKGDVIYDSNGHPVSMSGLCLDITERKKTENRLRFLARASAELGELVQQEDTLARVVKLAVPDFADWCAVDLLDEKRILKRVAVAHIDPAKVELAHAIHEDYPPDPNTSNGTWEVIRSGKSSYIPEISDELLESSIKDQAYLKIIRALGLRSYIGVPIRVRGETVGVLTFISAESMHVYSQTDVDFAEDVGRRAAVAMENSMLYQSLQQNDRRKDDFLAMLAHELRNPLAPISAASHLLAAQTDPAKVRKMSEIISRQVAHMTGLVNDLLDVSRVTRGHVELENEIVDLREALNQAIEQVSPSIESKRQQLSLMQLTETALWVQGDEKRLVQVIANLLNNASKFTGECGHINIRTRCADGRVTISVADNGIGMTEELLAGAFDLFVQGKTTIDRSQGGLGLGLALVKHIVELHGGRVKAYSGGINCGSEFVMDFPAADGNNLPQARDAAAPGLRDELSLRILVVDDNVDGAEMLAMVFGAAGHAVETSHHPFDSLKKMEGRSYDAIVLDIGLPEMDGRELARRIRARSGPVPLIVGVSGYGQEEDRVSAFEAGIDFYLVKPVDTDELLQLVGQRKTHAEMPSRDLRDTSVDR